MTRKYNKPKKQFNKSFKKYKKPRKPKYKDFGLCVFVENGNVESALKRLKKRVDEAKIMEVVYSKTYYEKPSDKKRRQKKSAKRLIKLQATNVQKDYRIK